jgi:hypothetical protein
MVLAYETVGGALDIAVGIVGALALIAYPVRKLIAWLTSHFVVTSDRLIHREGWLARRSLEIPLEAINDIRFSQRILERLVGAGDLTIRSAADSLPQVFRDIRSPEGVMKTIYHQMELNNQRMYRGMGTPASTPVTTSSPPPSSAPTPQAPPPPPAPTAPAAPTAAPAAPSQITELERLAELRDRGVLTEEEFQAQKAKILGQEDR